jgi:hypothetical protein
MTALEVLLVLLILLYFVWKLSSLAGRLDWTHVRRDNSLNSLRQYLAIRATCVARLVSSGKLDEQANYVLKASLEQVLIASEKSFRDYLTAESDLTGVLFEVFEGEKDLEPLMASTNTAAMVFDLARAAKRVQLARRFHNDAVGASQLLHARSTVRLFRLAGHTKMPTAVDLDDRVPNALKAL